MADLPSASPMPSTARSNKARARRPQWQLIAALGGFLVLVAVVLFGVHAQNRWHETTLEAEKIAANLAQVLAEHAGRVFDASNLVASQASAMAAGRSWDEVERSEAGFRALQSLDERFDYISAVWLVDADGTTRLTSRAFPAPRISVGDREHFRRLRAGEEGPTVSTLLRSRVVPEANIVLSSPIRDAEGRFRGAAFVVIDPTYFKSFYRSVEASYPASIDLFRSDRSVIIRHPPLPEDQAIGLRKWPDLPPEQTLVDSGVVDGVTSGADNVERLEVYRRVKDFPLYVSVGIPQPAISARWREAVMQQGAFALAALAALLLPVVTALSLARQEERARVDLETMNRSLEARVQERTAEVQRSAEGLRTLLAEKDALLREVHHRVKNNLQIISSLLNLHSGKFKSQEVRRSFTDCLAQVRAMGLVHELLYRSPNMAEIDFEEYLRVLGERLQTAYGRDVLVDLQIRAMPLHFNLDTTIPLALIVTEAMTNAFKHAFPEGRSGTIEVEVAQNGPATTIRIADNGVGLPESWDRLQPRSLGLTLMRVLADQIDAGIDYVRGPGTEVRLTLDQKADDGAPAQPSA